MSHMGTFIRARREKLKLSQAALARELDLDPSYMCYVERGARPLPPATYRRAAKILKTNVAQIVDVLIKDVKAKIHESIGDW